MDKKQEMIELIKNDKQIRDRFIEIIVNHIQFVPENPEWQIYRFNLGYLADEPDLPPKTCKDARFLYDLLFKDTNFLK